jgi:hypothetical protein
MQEYREHWRAVIHPFIGKEITVDGVQFELVDCNDLGILYWQKKGSKKLFVIAGWDIKRLLDSHDMLD